MPKNSFNFPRGVQLAYKLFDINQNQHHYFGMTFPLYSLDFVSVEVFHYFPTLPDKLLLVSIIFAPTIGYFDQLKKMLKTRSSIGFVLQNALIMLFTNTLRFIYWTFVPFTDYLLGQSIAVFCLQLILSLLSLTTSMAMEEKSLSSIIKLSFSFHNHTYHKLPYYFNIFQCKTAIDFLISLFLYFAIIISFFALSCLIMGMKITLTFVIFAANIVDTFISYPTFMKIVVHHEIHGMSQVLLFQQITGDILKLAMYTFGKSGYAFVFGAFLQTTMDAISVSSFLFQLKSSGYSILSNFKESKDTIDF